MEAAAQQIERVVWLIRLRWLALIGVSLGATLAHMGLAPGVNVGIVALAVALGALTNLWMWWRARDPDTDALHVGQALLDTGALSLVLWAAGGARCPFLSFYVFPVLLAALLSGRRALWATGAASALGLGFQLTVVRVPALQVGRWDPISPWDEVFAVTAVLLTVGMAAYFAARLTDALREQARARHEADAMLRLAFDGLDAGLEVVQAGRIVWQNPRAASLLGPRAGQTWRCPGAHGGPPCPTDLDRGGDGPKRCQFALTHDAGLERIYELLAFPLPRGDRHMVLYVDRTTEVLDQRRLMLTERLASLGRTVQGVAHELNTPLATIQTLGRDVLDVVGVASLPAEIQEDLRESAAMIVAEVQRCRRITHALLGRVDELDPQRRGLAPLQTAVERAVAVVFTHDRDRVTLTGLHGLPPYPLDPLVQIFVNLLQNARDAAPGAMVSIFGAREGEAVVVQLRDRGPGLSPASQDHLFEPFFTTKPPGTGTGLGLYTSYALARGLGAELDLGDHPEGGAVATLRLPLDDAERAADADPG